MKNYFHVSLENSKGETLKQVDFKEFNQSAIESKMKELAKFAKEGDQIEYWKQNNEFAYIRMLTIVKRNGRFLREVIRHGKVYYRKSLILA